VSGEKESDEIKLEIFKKKRPVLVDSSRLRRLSPIPAVVQVGIENEFC